MISAAIMGHPKRAALIVELAETLPDARVILDRRDEEWDTGRRALLAYDAAATHHLIAQDDCLPCRDVVPALERAVEVAGERPLGLYVGASTGNVNAIVRKAREQGRASWLQMEGPLWGPAIVIPTSHIDELVEWGDARAGEARLRNYDRRITRFYVDRGIDCWYTLPSLVDHRPGPSLLDHADDRRAHWFLGADRSALELDWDAEPVSIDLRDRVRFRHRERGHEKTVRMGSAAYRRMVGSPNVWDVVKRPKEKI